MALLQQSRTNRLIDFLYPISWMMFLGAIAVVVGSISTGKIPEGFIWESPPLPENQAFEVRIWQEGDSFHYGAHDALKSRESVRIVDDVYAIRLDLAGVYSVNLNGEGDYFWTVAIVEIEPTYRDLEIETQPHHIRIR